MPLLQLTLFADSIKTQEKTGFHAKQQIVKGGLSRQRLRVRAPSASLRLYLAFYRLECSSERYHHWGEQTRF
jgi:hypothetical protein